MLFTKFLSKTVDFTYEFPPFLIYVMISGFIFMDKVCQVIPAINIKERSIMQHRISWIIIFNTKRYNFSFGFEDVWIGRDFDAVLYEKSGTNINCFLESFA